MHGLGIDEPLAVEQKGKVYYYHLDGLGSVASLTDAKGKLVQRYDYDSFGKLKRHGHKVKQPYTYTGREWDKETGLYYYRARYYDSKVGRFLQKDPIGFVSGDATLYVMVWNNPINFVDPLGLLPKWMVPNNVIKNVQLIVNNITNYAFNQKQIDILTDTVIKEIKYSEALKANEFGTINPYEVPLTLTQSQSQFVEDIMERLLYNKELSREEHGLVVKGIEEYFKAKERGRCIVR